MGASARCRPHLVAFTSRERNNFLGCPDCEIGAVAVRRNIEIAEWWRKVSHSQNHTDPHLPPGPCSVSSTTPTSTSRSIITSLAFTVCDNALKCGIYGMDGVVGWGSIRILSS